MDNMQGQAILLFWRAECSVRVGFKTTEFEQGIPALNIKDSLRVSKNVYRTKRASIIID